MTKLVFYIRVSTKEQGHSRNGLEAQTAMLERFAHMGGHEVLASYEEVASGKHGLDRRPVLRAALDYAQRNKATLIVSKLDRLSRSVEFIANIMNGKAMFATVEDGLDWSPLQLHMKAMIAEHERHMISERTKAALASVKARGVSLGGIVRNHALGVQRGTQANRDEANAFALHIKPVMVRMRQAGMSVNLIAQELNEQGTKTARGGKWYPTTVANVLRRCDIPV